MYNAAPATVNRVICHCDDCQAFAHHLRRADLLDAHGGPDGIVGPPTGAIMSQFAVDGAPPGSTEWNVWLYARVRFVWCSGGAQAGRRRRIRSSIALTVDRCIRSRCCRCTNVALRLIARPLKAYAPLVVRPEPFRSRTWPADSSTKC